MITIEKALSAILRQIHPLPGKKTEISRCLNLILAEDIRAKGDLPPFPNSAMDGYAVKATDTRGASLTSPRELAVIEDLPAGKVARRQVTKGTAIKIMTGAPMPQGADAVVRVEDTGTGIQSSVLSEPGRPKHPAESPEQGAGGGKQTVRILREVRSGENVREAGESAKKGETVLRKGKVLRPQEIGMLAALGRSQAKAIPRPKVAIISTGDELQEISKNLARGKIFDCNRHSLTALVEQYGGIPVPLGIARDREAELRAKFKKALSCDMLLSSGGVSVGEYDLVKKVLKEMSGKFVVWQVKMKPGKPLSFGLIRGKPAFGLPGNPVSVVVSFLMFVRPALLKMQGRTKLRKPEVGAILAEKLTGRCDRTNLVRALVSRKDDRYYALPTGPQGSGILRSLVLANALLVIPPERGPIKKGEKIRAILIDEPETT